MLSSFIACGGGKFNSRLDESMRKVASASGHFLMSRSNKTEKNGNHNTLGSKSSFLGGRCICIKVPDDQTRQPHLYRSIFFKGQKVLWWFRTLFATVNQVSRVELISVVSKIDRFNKKKSPEVFSGPFNIVPD